MNYLELADEYRDLYEAAVDPETGEMADDAALIARLDAIGHALREKTEGVAMLRFQALAEADVIKAEVARLQRHLSLRTNLAERLKRYALAALIAAGEREVKTPRCVVRLKKPSQHVVVIDLDALPADFVKVERSARKAELLTALRSGADVPGAKLGLGEPTIEFR